MLLKPKIFLETVHFLVFTKIYFYDDVSFFLLYNSYLLCSIVYQKYVLGQINQSNTERK